MSHHQTPHACILATTQSLTIELIRNLESALKVEVVQHAAFYEHRLRVCVVLARAAVRSPSPVRQQGQLPH
jgi:hypothetical protein